MFGKLKEKLKSWIGKSEKPEKKAEKPKKIEKTKEKTIKKKEKPTKKLPTDEELKKQAEEIPDSQNVPLKFEVGQQQYIPDTEEIEKTKTKETPKEEPKEKKGFLSKLISKISGTKIQEEHVNEIFESLEIILLENNVALEVVDKIHQDLKKELIGSEVKKSEIENKILQTLKNSILDVLIDPPNLIDQIKSHAKKSKDPFVIIFFGINGSGKTTSIAKLAHLLKANNISCLLAAADTFRAAAVEQLNIHAERIKIPIIKSQYGSDPTSVAYDAKKYAQKNKIQCVLIDTAGRMYTKENLIKQMEKIIRIIQPDLKIFVGESITGNDATQQARTFHEAIGIDGMILSKADVDEKAGTILSVSYVTGKPIYFLGTGQSYKDLQEFKKSNVIKNLGLD